jgi:hypothetical protein
MKLLSLFRRPRPSGSFSAEIKDSAVAVLTPAAAVLPGRVIRRVVIDEGRGEVTLVLDGWTVHFPCSNFLVRVEEES